MGLVRSLVQRLWRGRGRRRIGSMRAATGLSLLVCLALYVLVLRNVFIEEVNEDYSASSPGKKLMRSRLLSGFYLASDQWRLRGSRVDANPDSRVRHLMADGRGQVDVVDDDGEWNDSISCHTIGHISDREFLAAGWTKAVYSGKYHGRSLAVKVVNTNGHDVQACMNAADATFQECYRKSAAKILKEILLLKELDHGNMLEVYGYCIPNGDFSGDDGGVVAMVTELGEPMDIIKLLQMSWEDRLRICLGVARLLYYLAHSPLGSVAMNDFRRQQFVLVDGEVKLSDVDDMSVEEPPCPATGEPCAVHLPVGNVTLPVECSHGFCRGFNEKLNTAKAGRHFTTLLLPHGAPPSLRSLVDEIVRAYNTVSCDSKQILSNTEKLVHLYVSGNYLKRGKQPRVKTHGYRKYQYSDLPGEFDYRCQLSLSGNGCTLSVFDDLEARDICSRDPDCKAFVMTNQTTWTGRKLVHFKSNYSEPQWNGRTALYVKEIG